METKYHYYVAFEHRFTDVNEAFKFMGIKAKKAPKTNSGLFIRYVQMEASPEVPIELPKGINFKPWVPTWLRKVLTHE